ncbi:MAG TPA: FAD-binding oxidoreductase [Gemmataceae bacterium]|nr:FAD-binding oxidoreductase [Gemmataceae bacterium]
MVDHNQRLLIVEPKTVAELLSSIRQALAQGLAVYPFGGRTMWEYGGPPTREGIGVDLRGLDQVIDYPARDMTITVQAGITLSRLQEILAKENQRLPVDVPLPESATLGGALAANVSGPRRYGFGTFRDYVIGISVVNDEGQEIKAGGRVVKNVAGYDLCKLYIGSLGTLGIITQVTLKLKPRPEEQRLVAIGCKGGVVLGQLLDLLHGSRTRPVCLEVLNARAARQICGEAVELSEADWLIVLGFEDNRESVAWQVKQIEAETRPVVDHRDAALLSVRDSDRFWRALIDFQVWPGANLTFKANLLPSATADFCRLADARPEGLILQAQAGNGIVFGHVHGDCTLEQSQEMLGALQEAAMASQGNLLILRCPAAWKASLPVWGAPRNDYWLMKAVKEKLDPKGIFNPGRFVAGI